MYFKQYIKFNDDEPVQGRREYYDVLSSEEEKVFLVGLSLPHQSVLISEQNLKELEKLSLTAGAKIVGSININLRQINSTTFIGKGNAEKIEATASEANADTVIFDEDLSPSQQRNLEEILGRKVIDRTALILDIFAQKAHSHEGKLQVELAQLQYMLPRLRGMGVILSRLGGGIGTRGPGETKLETDRRRILKRISTLKHEIKLIEKNRSVQRKQRSKNQIPAISMIGYTNAGKSTLLNALTDAKVLVEDKLFSTLDPTAKKLFLPDNSEVILIDTVGFIRKLPHSLIASFHATLEEINYADLILLVIDSTSQFREEELRASYEVLKVLKIKDKPIITVLNKIDLVDDMVFLTAFAEKNQPSVKISAIKKINLVLLLEEIQKCVNRTKITKKYLIPYNRYDLLAKTQSLSESSDINYLDDKIEVIVRIDTRFLYEIERDKDIIISEK